MLLLQFSVRSKQKFKHNCTKLVHLIECSYQKLLILFCLKEMEWNSSEKNDLYLAHVLPKTGSTEINLRVMIFHLEPMPKNLNVEKINISENCPNFKLIIQTICYFEGTS